MREVTYLRPRDVAHAVRLCEGTPDARPLGGGTDLMVMLHARTIRPRALVDLWSLAELKGIRRADGGVEIGAAEPYTGIIASALVAEHCLRLSPRRARSAPRRSRTGAPWAAIWRTHRRRETRCPYCSRPMPS